MTRIVHLSHLNITQDSIGSGRIQSLRSAILGEKPDLLAICGGITARGDRASFIAARDFLNGLQIPFIVLHGPSDLSGFNLWQRFYDPVRFMRDYISPIEESIHEEEGLFIVAMNTVRPYLWGGKTSNGMVTQAQIQTVHNQFRSSPDQAVRILMTHHSLIATGTPRSGSIIWGARDLLYAMEDQKIDLILSSHPYKSGVHQDPTPESKSPMIIESAPAAAHFNVIRIHPDRIQIDLKTHSASGDIKIIETHQRWRTMTDDSVIDQEQGYS